MGNFKNVKYLFIFLCCVKFLFAQDISINKIYLNNNGYNNSTQLKVHSIGSDQNLTINNSDSRSPSMNLDQLYKMEFTNKKFAIVGDDMKNQLIAYPFKVTSHQKIQRKPTFNIVSSFRENIRFGGFWDKYAIINFTPAINLQPFEFLSINANQSLSCFVPISGIKEHFKSLFLQGAAILAVDNSVKLFFSSNRIIAPIIGFTLKNLIISVLKRTLEKKSEKQIFSYGSYYYSMKIVF